MTSGRSETIGDAAADTSKGSSSALIVASEGGPAHDLWPDREDCHSPAFIGLYPEFKSF
jgi:hypothetical protein